ncbi:MAG: hypothetical protein Q9217_005060 [Psora testacea]
MNDYWAPLLALAAVSTILQFATFGYCIKVYIRSLFDDKARTSMSRVSSSGLPSYNSRSGSVKSVTAGQAYRRIKKVIALQWRGTAIVLIIIVNVVYLAVVFVQMDNTVTAALQDLGRAEPWLLCLVLNEGNKSACLDKVKEAHLVTREPKVMAVLLLLSLNGIWALMFLGRTSMIYGWVDVIKRPFTRRKTDFVSVDARRYSAGSGQYDMITSPPSRSYSMPKEPKPVMSSPPVKEEGLSPLAQSPSSHYEDDYLGNETHNSKETYPYCTPKLSFSTPWPPSAVQTLGRDLSTRRIVLKDGQAANPSFPAQSAPIEWSFSSPSTASRTGAYSPAAEWDPTNTHGKSSR